MAIPPGAREAIQRAAAELAAVPPFSALAPVDRARLAAALEEATYEAGNVIFAQGAEPDALYILRQGVVERQADGVRLDVIQAPAVFGDLALLRHEPRATTLRALGHCLVWRLPADRFSRLLGRTPAIATFFAAEVSSRLANRQIEVAGLANEFQGLAEQLYSGLDRHAQEVLESLALLPELDERVVRPLLRRHGLHVNDLDDPTALPLADILLQRRDGQSGPQRTYPPAFRRFLIGRLLDRLGAVGLANQRREVAALVRAQGVPRLALEVLLEGDLVAEAVELADREVEALRRAGRLDEARELARLLPASALAEHTRLQELGALPPTPAQVAAPERRRRVPGKRVWGVVVGLLILVVLWFVPAPPGLSGRGWHALVALLASLPLLALEALPDGIIALLLASVWVVGGVTSPSIALGGFASTQWVLVVSTLAVGVAIASSGLLYRMALWTVAHSRGGFAGQVVSLGIAGMLVGPAVPNATSRVALVAPAVGELVDAVGYPPYSPAAVGLSMAVLIGFGQIVAIFLTSSSTSVLVYAVLPDASRAAVNWGGWFVRALPTHILLFAGLAAFIVWRFAPRGQDQSAGHTRSALALQQALLGPPSRHEVIAIAVTLFVLVGFSTQPLHHVDGAWIGVLALGILAGSGVLTTNGLGSVNWSFALLSGILTSMSAVFADTQLDQWLAALATRALGSVTSTPVLFVAALTLLCYGLSLIMRWQAAAPLLTISLSPVGLGAGIDPWIIGLVALIACNGFFLPYQSTTYLALHSGTGGRLFSHHQARPVALAYAVITLLALCASVPAWRLMGLL